MELYIFILELMNDYVKDAKKRALQVLMDESASRKIHLWSSYLNDTTTQ